jgi:hypothetical protein
LRNHSATAVEAFKDHFFNLFSPVLLNDVLESLLPLLLWEIVKLNSIR